jgi:hypothetical protein
MMREKFNVTYMTLVRELQIICNEKQIICYLGRRFGRRGENINVSSCQKSSHLCSVFQKSAQLLGRPHCPASFF